MGNFAVDIPQHLWMCENKECRYVESTLRTWDMVRAEERKEAIIHTLYHEDTGPTVAKWVHPTFNNLGINCEPLLPWRRMYVCPRACAARLTHQELVYHLCLEHNVAPYIFRLAKLERPLLDALDQLDADQEDGQPSSQKHDLEDVVLIGQFYETFDQKLMDSFGTLAVARDNLSLAWWGEDNSPNDFVMYRGD